MLKTKSGWGTIITLIRVSVSPCINVSWIILPWYDRHKISNKWWNTAFENSWIASNHIFIVHFCLVKLLDNCNTDTSNIQSSEPYLQFTIIRCWRIECISLIGVPWHNTNKVCYKWWHLTLENSWVTTDGVFFVHICIIELLHHCNQSQEGWGLIPWKYY